jgi:hypothetical protein
MQLREGKSYTINAETYCKDNYIFNSSTFKGTIEINSLDLVSVNGYISGEFIVTIYAVHTMTSFNIEKFKLDWILFDNDITKINCTCGAKHTSFPDHHSDWCDLKKE